jgi:hypothetical protein
VKRELREASSGEESRYGLSKRTDLLRVVCGGVEVAAAKVEDRDESFGVVGVWPLNCAWSSSYCLRSLGSWVCRSDRLFPSVSCLFSGSSSSATLMGVKGQTYSPSADSCSSACAVNVSRPARRDSSDRVMGPSVLLLEGSLRDCARWRSRSESLMWSARRKSWCGDVDMIAVCLCMQVEW